MSVTSFPARLPADHAVKGSLGTPVSPSRPASSREGKPAGREIIHGEANTYAYYKCRCDKCRLAASIHKNRYRAMREARGGRTTKKGTIGGHLLLPAERTREQIVALHRVMPMTKVAELAGRSRRHLNEIASGRATKVREDTQRTIERLWQDYCAPVERSSARWPIDPVLKVILARYGSLNASPWHVPAQKAKERGSVGTDGAEAWADRLRLHPIDLWPDWYEAQ